ncbi:MAG TPA: MoxR family ATPase [Polyangiaceae bacterium]|nr:MoxR family ATPase [Polyangiaceae bacterium]
MASKREEIAALRSAVQAAIVGQEHVVECLVLALLCSGHALLEGLPGLGKTRSVKMLASALGVELHRVQFTPDLLPSDVTGSLVYRAETGKFSFDSGPIFGHVVLIDEINRAPAKVQSALLEAMEERQVTVGGETHELPEPFFVLATQNPIEQEGTYPLPEAQLDRFLLHVEVGYPSRESELGILRLVRREEQKPSKPQGGSIELIRAARQEIQTTVKVAENVERYIVDLVVATREPKKLDDELGSWIEIGASPRAVLSLDKVSRARAWLEGRDYVTADDVRAVAPAVLRHRLILAYEAKAKNVSATRVVAKLLDVVAIAG